ncbi:6-carboxytetrahydropterin synthase [Acidiplasma cupricumulans]|uniref:6-pyruvoyl trahydropterin synthase family protein n=1 Tax=Acidiplasma cupricumulans TaxID=312540 RepID=UPI000781BED1|nr:6-carboxytetrahydropterin synthase [Acidiplasma cupricumulans]
MINYVYNKNTWKGKNLTWSSGHYVPDNIKCRRLHGHDYALDVEIQCNEISENGMVIDFTVIKIL